MVAQVREGRMEYETGKVSSDVGRWGMIPEWLLDSGVSAQAIRLFAVLACKYADKETDHAYPSRKKLAKDCAVSDRSIDTYVDELISAGALLTTHRKRDDGSWGSNDYKVHYARPPGATSVEGGGTAGDPTSSSQLQTITQNQYPESVVPKKRRPPYAKPDWPIPPEWEPLQALEGYVPRDYTRSHRFFLGACALAHADPAVVVKAFALYWPVGQEAHGWKDPVASLVKTIDVQISKVKSGGLNGRAGKPGGNLEAADFDPKDPTGIVRAWTRQGPRPDGSRVPSV